MKDRKEPGILQSVVSHTVRHNLTTEQIRTQKSFWIPPYPLFPFSDSQFQTVTNFLSFFYILLPLCELEPSIFFTETIAVVSVMLPILQPCPSQNFPSYCLQLGWFETQIWNPLLPPESLQGKVQTPWCGLRHLCMYQSEMSQKEINTVF